MLSQNGFAPILIIVSLVIIFAVAGGSYYLGKQQAQTQTNLQKAATISTQPMPSPNAADSGNPPFKEIEYLSKYSSANQGYDRTVFITTNDKSHDLKIADLNLTPNSIKTLYSISLPAAMGFNPPIYSIGTYLVANISGGDAGDIMIFDSNGKAITESVYTSNPELDRWHISYKGESLGRDEIVINLFRIDGSQATARIDLKTGKVIPNSLITVK